MKKLHLFAAIAVAASLSACGGGETKKAGNDNDPKSKSPGTESQAVNKGDAVNDTKEVMSTEKTEAVEEMATETTKEVTEKAAKATATEAPAEESAEATATEAAPAEESELIDL